jgi:hypothetical protein
MGQSFTACTQKIAGLTLGKGGLVLLAKDPCGTDLWGGRSRFSFLFGTRRRIHLKSMVGEQKSLLLHEPKLRPPFPLRRCNPLAACRGYPASPAWTLTAQPLQYTDGFIEPVNNCFSFPVLLFENGDYVEFWHAGQCSAPKETSALLPTVGVCYTAAP